MTLKYFAFASSILFSKSSCEICDVMLSVTSITTSALKNVLATLLPTGLAILSYINAKVTDKIIRILHECGVLIEKSVPRVTVCKTVTRGSLGQIC